MGTHLLNSDSIRSRNAEPRKEGFGLSWSWEQERFEFLAEKALWRPEGRELLIADLHLGKAEVFQAHGIPLPSDGDRGTLNPLLDLCARVQPKTLIILGDLVHGPLGLTASLLETLAALGHELCQTCHNIQLHHNLLTACILEVQHTSLHIRFQWN